VSVEKVQRATGPVWRVRWRDPQGHPHSRVVGRKSDAQAFDAELKRSKRLGGTPLIDNSRETLAEFAKVWWERYAVPNLQRHTLATYASMLDVHIVPRLGKTRLRSMTPELVSELRAQMTADRVGEAAIRKTLVLLQGILERAVEWRHLESNPARGVRKPSQRRTRAVRPLPPATIEQMRAHLLYHGRQLDAALIAVLAYAGLRPGEALGLRWHDLGERTLLVERSVAFGQLKPTKTGQTRTVKLLPPLIDTLAAWRRATHRNAPTDLFFPAPDGSPWSLDRVNNWRKRTFANAAAAAGVRAARPYDLRHSYISLLIAEGTTVVEVARQAGHSPTMTLSTYAHLFDEFREADRTSAEDLVRAARAAASAHEVSVLCPPAPQTSRPGVENACKIEVGDPGFEPGTSSLSEKRSNRLS
jgi:integrase